MLPNEKHRKYQKLTHQLTLTNLYITQNDAYVAAYTAFETRCAAAATTLKKIQILVAKLRQQQMEIILLQLFLWSSKTLVDGLWRHEINHWDQRYSGRQRGFSSGGGNQDKGTDGTWR
jgi:hypothetical protein